MRKGSGSIKPRLSSHQSTDDAFDIAEGLGDISKGREPLQQSVTPKKRMRRGQSGGLFSSRFFFLSYLQLCVLGVLLFIFCACYYAYNGLVPKSIVFETSRRMPTPEILTKHCKEHIGPPRVEQITDTLFVAVGYDLANTILVKTSEGHVVIDVAMSPKKSRVIRAALIEKAGEAPIHTIIYTHSHMDHVGGATGWAEPGTKIWSTDALSGHFFKQYGVFRKTESLRGSRQYGSDVPVSELPCSGLGARADLAAMAAETGFLMPTDTFSGKTSFQVGEEVFELVEAHGETHDQLFVWLPRQKALLPGDNYYQSFPNLYTIRGTSARPVRMWIRSLDEMRLLQPEFLVPSHTGPVRGREAVQRQLTDYRDAIAWVFVQTVRGANEGKSVDELAMSIGLPPHLRENDALDELYGQIDWSVRAIYSNELGWFDGEAEDLYPLPYDEAAHKTVLLMGGPAKVLKVAEEAQASNDHRWALHLLKLLRTAAPRDNTIVLKTVTALEASSLTSLGRSIFNTNGRAYLMQSAVERTHPGVKSGGEHAPHLTDAFIDAIPVDLMFDVLATRLRPDLSIDSHEAIVFQVGDAKYYVTVRKGVAEVSKGQPLYGMPEPVGTLVTNEATFRRIALSIVSPATAIINGDVKVEGDQVRFLQVISKFERGA